MRLVAAIAIGIFAAFVVIFALRQPAPDTTPMTNPQAKAAETTAELYIEPVLIEVFGNLSNYVDRTMISEPDPDTGIFDTQVWEWALDGNAILIRHALSDGAYGGDTYIFPSQQSDGFTYHYITNAGFATVGEMALNGDGSWIAIEDVSGHEKWTQVRSTGRPMPDGTLISRAEYTADGETWEAGHSFTYKVAPAGTKLPRLKLTLKDSAN